MGNESNDIEALVNSIEELELLENSLQTRAAEFGNALAYSKNAAPSPSREDVEYWKRRDFEVKRQKASVSDATVERFHSETDLLSAKIDELIVVTKSRSKLCWFVVITLTLLLFVMVGFLIYDTFLAEISKINRILWAGIIGGLVVAVVKTVHAFTSTTFNMK